ncbi:MAG TPA: tetratricopeptide repeat protein [Bacteroidia bacterium]|nr:tetratricopeptide repeat protein [Bacteroidia bacterium]
MSAKTQKYNKPTGKPAPKGSQQVPKVKVALPPEYPVWLHYALLGGVLIITYWCYHLTLHNQFTNWDDGLYIYENAYIKNLSANLHSILMTSAGIAYFHPLTMLTIALNYKYSGLNPESYYMVNILLHLLNTALIYLLSLTMLNAMVKKGYGKIKGIPYLAALCALWHGIHPMHVESVSWIAERKDVLYLVFYLMGMIMYVKYVMEGKIMQMVSVVLFFILALASKPLAVVFPLSLLAIDILLKRDKLFEPKEGSKLSRLLKIGWKLLLNKIPFLVVSMIFGVVTFRLQKESGSITAQAVFTTIQRISFVGMNYLMYLAKLFVPTHLCSFYPYPELTDSNNLPFYFYLTPFIALGVTLTILYLAYKVGENLFRVVLFGFGYYFFNVMFILQFVSSGPSIMADRYSYASYVGFVFMLVFLIYYLIDKIPAIKTPVIAVIAVYSCLFAYLCQARTEVWHSTKTLWSDVIKKYPATIDTVYKADHSQYVIHVHQGVETAYKNLGNYYVQDKTPPDYDSAYMNYVVLENIKSKDAGVYSNLGNIWAIRNNFKKSLEGYTHSLSLDSKNFDTYLDRAITYSRMGYNDSAMRDYNHAFHMDSNNQKLLENRGYTYLDGVKDYNAAIADYNRLIAIDPNNHDYYFKRGIAEFNLGKMKEAIDDFLRELNANPKNNGCLFDLSLSYKAEKQYTKAIEYAQKAEQYGFKLSDNYISDLQKMAKSGGE